MKKKHRHHSIAFDNLEERNTYMQHDFDVTIKKKRKEKTRKINTNVFVHCFIFCITEIMKLFRFYEK